MISQLFSSVWFSENLLQCLTIYEIAKLDWSISNHFERNQWLICLKNTELPLVLNTDTNDDIIGIIKWIIARNIQVYELCLTFEDDKYTLSNDLILRLAHNSPHLKKLQFCGDYTNNVIEEESFQHFASFCYNLEEIVFHGCVLPDNALQSISKTCHNLKRINLRLNEDYVDYVSDDGNIADENDLLLLLKNNQSLEFLELENMKLSCEIFAVLGHYCTQFRSLNINNAYNYKLLKYDITDTQIEIFTKGCPNLTNLKINKPLYQKCNKLFQCLGTYNSLLESIEICGTTSETPLSISYMPSYENVITAETITYESLDRLSTGCPLLKDIKWSFLHLSISGIASLVNHCISIEKIDFFKCELTDDMLLEIGKLSNLKSICLYCNSSITDQGVANLVKSYGYNLENIELLFCCQLTDISLYTIATYCKQLKRIEINDINENLSQQGFAELFLQCSSLIKIDTERLGINKLSPKLNEELRLRTENTEFSKNIYITQNRIDDICNI